MKLLTGARPLCSDTDLLSSSSYCPSHFVVAVETDVYFNESVEIWRKRSECSCRCIVSLQIIYTCSDVNNY